MFMNIPPHTHTLAQGVFPWSSPCLAWERRSKEDIQLPAPWLFAQQLSFMEPSWGAPLYS